MIGASVAVCLSCLLAGIICLGPGKETAPVADGSGGPAEYLPPPSPLAMERQEQQQDFVRATLVDPAALRAGDTAATFTIGRKQAFYEALQQLGAPHADIIGLVEACRPYRNLGKVKRGDSFRIVQAADKGVRSFGFDLDVESYLDFVRRGDEYVVVEGTYPVEHRVCGVSGVIENSLYASLQAAGAPLSLAPKMNDVLGWEIDFNRDLRRGDSFRIIYEEIWRNGELVRTGSILALECVNRSQPHRAFHFVDPDGRPGYFDPDGANFQKQLMRAPLQYSRISSHFSYSRMHPILKRRMPHLGVDYAAPVGTPVRAAGDGVVVAATRKTGNGRYVQIRHTNREYESFYLHLSRYAKGIKKGARVKQGQVIGYVGATGYATGPHLDYRVKRNGTFVNPRKLKLPAAAPVDETAMPSFALLRDLYARSLEDLPEQCSPLRVAHIETTVPPYWNPATFQLVMVPEFMRPVTIAP